MSENIATDNIGDKGLVLILNRHLFVLIFQMLISIPYKLTKTGYGSANSKAVTSANGYGVLRTPHNLLVSKSQSEINPFALPVANIVKLELYDMDRISEF